MKDLTDIAYADAHKDYEKRKNEIVTKLNTICDVYGSHISPTAVKWLQQAVNFIKESKEHEG